MQRAARVREQYGGEAEYTHDFNLGNIPLAQNTIREIQQHQPHSVPWRCVPSRGVPWKVEGWVEGPKAEVFNADANFGAAAEAFALYSGSHQR